ncbi:cold-shock protein [Kordia sp.]|uniref:cold-shock protein n=1 Tax=Kordia sp. TaxID=1965332 RepID=UPI003D28343F
MTGTVKFFNEDKGFGFITNEDTGRDIFVHISNLNGLVLNEGDNVSYEEADGRKGVVAADVQIIE